VKIKFMNRTTQSTNIKQAINELLDKGLTDKQDIYSKVVEELGVPRPTVRRVARDLRNELLQKIKILQSEGPEIEIAQGKTT
jgi:predicted XRE-type DNA-binding protein